MKKLIVLIMVLGPLFSFGQFDEVRMETDLRVAKSTLQIVIQSIQNEFSGSTHMQANYVKGFGVIINVPAHEVLYKGFLRLDDRSLNATNGKITIGEPTDSEEKKREDFANYIKKQEEVAIEAFKIFLVDYASLISQLKLDEKVFITMTAGSGLIRMSRGSEYLSYDRGNEPYYISGEISKSMLDDLKSGKQSRDQALKTIKVGKNEVKEAPKDIKGLASIFNSLYSDNSTETFWASGRWFPEYTPNVGIVLTERFYSSRRVYANGKKIFNMPTIGKSNISQEERDKSVNDFYPVFLTEIKSNILDYGRTVQSLKPNEMFIIKATFDDCEGCDIPEKVEISLKADVLAKYNSGELSKEKAASQIGVKEIGKQ